MTTTTDDVNLLMPTEAAKLLNISPVTLRQLARKGSIQAVITPGGHRRFRLEDVNSYAEKIKYAAINPSDRPPGPTRILIVDDDPDIGEMLRDQLLSRKTPVEVDFVSDGWEANNKVRSFKPDVILLDFKMPKITGDIICAQIKAMEGMANVRIIAMTGYITDAIKERFMNSGAEDVIAKPIDIDNLFRLVELHE